jgi:glycosyltransferase involved in cell wall biosynthesis
MENLMQIGMFSWESLYSIKVGGVAPHVSELSEALVRKGHEVHIFTRRGDFGPYDQINGVHYQRIDHVQSGDIVCQMDEMCNAIFERFGHVQDLFGQFDVVHGHDWHPVSALNRIKAEYGLQYVSTIHSTEWGRCGNNISYDPIPSKISHQEWSCGYESSQIIATTQRMKDELGWIYSIPEYKINLIPNGIISGSIRRDLDTGKVKERYGIHPFAPVILFCGRMSYQKGPDLLVEAIPHVLRKHWDAKFVFVGEGDMRAGIEHRARELNVSHSSHFLGYTSNSVKEEWMNSCDLLCIPSRNEPFGIVALEGWDAGKPIVATEAVSIINNYEDGLISYVQPESIAWCINYLLDSSEMMKKLSEGGRKRVEREFKWDKIAEATEKVYEKAIYG